jgi:hypothetical protein
MKSRCCEKEIIEVGDVVFSVGNECFGKVYHIGEFKKGHKWYKRLADFGRGDSNSVWAEWNQIYEEAVDTRYGYTDVPDADRIYPVDFKDVRVLKEVKIK